MRKDARLRLSVNVADFNLHLSGLTLEDASEYTCEVDIMARPISIPHKLEVLVPPRVQCKDTKVTSTVPFYYLKVIYPIIVV